MARCSAVAATVFLAMGAAQRLDAQSTSSSLGDSRIRQLPTPEQVKDDLDAAPFSLGPVRLLPRLEISELGYDSNILATEHPESDEVVRGRAGLRLILPAAGRKFFLTGDVLPGYDYYYHHAELRRPSGHYGGSLLGLFNRLQVEVKGATDRGREILSTEILQPIGRQTDSGAASAEVQLVRQLGLVLEYGRSRVRYDRTETLDPAFASISLLNRTESAGRAGLRYHFGERVTLAGLVEGARADFVETPAARNNRSTAYLLLFHYDRTHLYVDLEGGYRKVKPETGTPFPEFGGATGRVFAAYLFPAQWLGVEAYAHRGLDYSLFETASYFREERVGGGPSFRFGSRIELWVFGETGRNVYPASAATPPGAVAREDRVQGYGGELTLALSRRLAVRVNATSSRYNSNIGGFDRTVFRVRTGLSWNGEAYR